MNEDMLHAPSSNPTGDCPDNNNKKRKLEAENDAVAISQGDHIADSINNKKSRLEENNENGTEPPVHATNDSVVVLSPAQEITVVNEDSAQCAAINSNDNANNNDNNNKNNLFQILPEEIICSILAFTDDLSLGAVMTQVCMRWRLMAHFIFKQRYLSAHDTQQQQLFL
eukprot:GEZU01024829.1.p1 GENE.GEZU01024829.1~~GEZU01024829.1.p1  ORF type:complete len:169 (+),score=43.20 GEZU01024829.1:21-527(+)